MLTWFNGGRKDSSSKYIFVPSKVSDYVKLRKLTGGLLVNQNFTGESGYYSSSIHLTTRKQYPLNKLQNKTLHLLILSYQHQTGINMELFYQLIILSLWYSNKQSVNQRLNLYHLFNLYIFYCFMNVFFPFDIFIVYIPECKKQLRTMK